MKTHHQESKPRGRRRPLLGVLLATGLAAAAGCQHYDVQVAIEPDGTGQRTVDFTIEGSGDDAALTNEQLRDFFRIDASHGWTLVSGKPPDAQASAAGATYRHAMTCDDPTAWDRADGELRIQARPGERPDVVFANDLDVRLLESEEGRVCQYRETFSWTGLRQEITSFMADRFVEQVHAAYPFLTTDELHELRGLLAGMVMLHLQATGEYEDQEPDDELTVAAILAHAEDVLRRHPGDHDTTEMNAIVRASADDPMGVLDHHVAQQLPGAYHAASTALNLSVTMPGPIIDTNADRIDGQMVSWEMSIWDASAHPVEVFATSEIAD